MKLVSVIVPTYNVERYIAATVQSVLAQSYPHFELLIIDDESPDRSVEIVQQQFQDPRIKIIHQKNRGLAGARNTGIRHAQGDYLAFLDSDDLWLPEKLEKHVQHLEQNPEVGLSFSRSAFMDGDGQPLGIYQMPKLKDITAPHLLCRNPIGNGSAPVIRRAVLEEIKFYTERYGTREDFYFDDAFRQSEDIECWIRIILQTQWKIEGIPEALTRYRVNTEGLSAQIMKQYRSWEQVIEKTRTYAPEVVAQYEAPARAYQFRYLARRAVRLKDAKMAVELVNRALKTHWQILIAEPQRTGLTLCAAYLMSLLPTTLYPRIESMALQITGALQQLRIHTDQGKQRATS